MDIVKAVEHYGSIRKAAAALGLSKDTARRRYDKAILEIEAQPDGEIPLDELLERRKKDFKRKEKAALAGRLVHVKVKDRKPIGVTFFGDPHVDDDGTDIGLLEKHAEIARDTDGMYGMCLGDISNNWVGRLARLYGNQETSASTAWRLTEWFLRMVPWLALVDGNHDLWSGSGDPINWIMRGAHAVRGTFDTRVSLDFANGRSCRVWMRHDFPGHSQWNPMHALNKAAMLGNDFHIFAAGHKHIAAHHEEFSPEMGHFWHTFRASGYKVIDEYADTLGLRKIAEMPAGTFIIDPHAQSEAGFVKFDPDVESAAQYLTWLRTKR